MKTVEELVRAYSSKKLGNHRVELLPNGKELYYYYSTVICEVHNGRFKVSNGGYGTSSTKRAIGAYRKEFQDSHVEDLVLTLTKKKRDGSFEAEDQVGFKWIINPDEHGIKEFVAGAKYECQVYHGKVWQMLLDEEEEVLV